MIPRHFVVRDDLVVPIDHVEAAVGAELHGYGPERLVATDEEIRPLAVGESLTGPRGDDRLDRVRDRVGDVEHFFVGSGIRSGSPGPRPAVGIVGEREAAQARAAHLRRPERGRHHRLIGAEAIRRTGGHEHAWLIGKNRKADVVGLLEPGLTRAGDREAPDVVGPGRERLECRSVGLESPKLAGVEPGFLGTVGEGRAAGPRDGGSVEQPLSEQDPAARHARELMRKEVRILHPKSLEHCFVPIGAAVAIRIAIEADLRAILHERAVAPGQHAERDREPLCKHARLPGLLRPRLVEHEHLVVAAVRIERASGLGCLVSVDGIVERGRRPQPPVGIKGKGDELAVWIRGVGALFEHELGGEARGEREVLGFVRSRERLGGGRSRRGRSAHRRTRQAADRDVLDLDLRLAAAVHLEADLAVERDRRVGLDIVERGHAVDPRPDRRPLGHDSVVVPVVFLDCSSEGLRVLRLADHLVASRFVVELAPPAGAGIDLVAPHLVRIGHAHAADLDPGVHEAARAADADLERELEVCK